METVLSSYGTQIARPEGWAHPVLTLEILAVKLHELAPIKTILDDLPFYDVAHFAYHGFGGPQSPFRSGLLLCGDEPEKDFNENT